MSEALPDAYSQKNNDGLVVVVANKKARRVLNANFKGSRPYWGKTVGDNLLTSPTYRAIEIEDGPAMFAMLCTLHRAGLTVAYRCRDCDRIHTVDDEVAAIFSRLALAGNAEAAPAHVTVQ